MSDGTGIDQLRALREEARQGGGPKRVERQHAQGKLTARERIDGLLDRGSFQEIGMFVHPPHGRRQPGQAPGRQRGHRLGAAGGRVVYVYAQDFTVIGGSLGEVHAEKIVKLEEIAMKNGAPIVGLMDSGGARIEEGGGQSGGFCRYLPAQRSGLGGGAPDIVHHGTVRRRRGLFASADRFHRHGQAQQPHVHHRPRGGQGGHPGRGLVRGVGRRDDPQHAERGEPHRGRERRGRVVPAARTAEATCRRTTWRTRRCGRRPTTRCAPTARC